ncbi:hypothetical protein EVAR_44774_1 [Eumeta japonica]|uniref:Uncharacterized protein n=1 Tax=Eumeta variegata TaxID=151549 RepID=A0A4C1Y667_EUMVA|nr:hypothetical protein EVAR_44774_1 [Eumeta japonica]
MDELLGKCLPHAGDRVILASPACKLQEMDIQSMQRDVRNKQKVGQRPPDEPDDGEPRFSERTRSNPPRKPRIIITFYHKRRTRNVRRRERLYIDECNLRMKFFVFINKSATFVSNYSDNDYGSVFPAPEALVGH